MSTETSGDGSWAGGDGSTAPYSFAACYVPLRAIPTPPELSLFSRLCRQQRTLAELAVGLAQRLEVVASQYEVLNGLSWRRGDQQPLPIAGKEEAGTAAPAADAAGNEHCRSQCNRSVLSAMQVCAIAAVQGVTLW